MSRLSSQFGWQLNLSRVDAKFWSRCNASFLPLSQHHQVCTPTHNFQTSSQRDIRYSTVSLFTHQPRFIMPLRRNSDPAEPIMHIILHMCQTAESQHLDQPNDVEIRKFQSELSSYSSKIKKKNLVSEHICNLCKVQFDIPSWTWQIFLHSSSSYTKLPFAHIYIQNKLSKMNSQ